jgi:hypothetical protein
MKSSRCNDKNISLGIYVNRIYNITAWPVQLLPILSGGNSGKKTEKKKSNVLFHD